jgi:hypothetical protein
MWGQAKFVIKGFTTTQHYSTPTTQTYSIDYRHTIYSLLLKGTIMQVHPRHKGSRPCGADRSSLRKDSACLRQNMCATVPSGMNKKECYA